MLVAGHRADSLAALVRETLAVPAGERSAWLRSRCSGDPALAARVRDALPTEPGDTPSPSPLLRPLESVPESARRIGPYALRGILGEGTFGIVYLADQRDPIPRRVALKVLKPALAGREVLARFDRERRLLARLDHPGIAHVLDAGVTDDGRPWFAIEFVRGLPLMRHCDEARLSVDSRVRLFEEICRAVHHAHQCGVLHRDLKPGNILVAQGQPGDGTPAWGLPKVIDFGIAEAIGGDAAESRAASRATTDSADAENPHGSDGESAARTIDAGAQTESGAFSRGLTGTLEYMSPEQALGLELDPRSDVYALGAILHHLLTGAPPLGESDAGGTLGGAPLGSARSADAVLAFVARLRSDDPLAPSEAVSSLTPDRAAIVARDRSTTPPRLVRALRGDLDWIVRRCLAKDRATRYDSAADLAADLRRHLAAQPVESAPPSVSYRLSRFVRRHQRATAAAVISVVSMLVAMAVVASALRVAIRARDAAHDLRQIADRSAAEATDALGALLSLITRLSLDNAASGAGSTPEQLLAAARDELIAPFREQPRAQAEVRIALGKAFLSLDHPRSAESEISAAIALLGTLGSAGEGLLVDALSTQASIATHRERFDEAAALLDRAFDLQRRSDPADPAVAATLWLDRSRLALARGDGAAARRSVSEARRAMMTMTDPAARRRVESSASFFEAQALALDGRWKEALAAIQPNLAYNRAMMPGHWWVAESTAVEAAALIGVGDLERGQALLAEWREPLLRALPERSTPRRVIVAIVARALASRQLDAEAAEWQRLAKPPAPASGI